MTKLYTGYTQTKAHADLESLPQLIPPGRTVTSAAEVVANNVPYNVRDYMATGNGASDDTPCLQAAIDAAKASDVGGIIRIPPGRYNFTTLDFSGCRNVTVEGSSSAAPDSANTSALICTVAGGGTAISLASSQGVTFRHVKVYDTGAFTGTLVKTGWSALNRDPSHLRLEQCTLSASGVLLDLEKALFVTLDQVAFRGGTRQIIGHQGTYSNVVMVRGCEFGGASLIPILQPGEAWTFEGCAFEPMAGNHAGAIEPYTTGGTYFSYALRVVGCWFGDATGAGKTWIKARMLGGEICGNFGVIEGTDTFLLLAASSVAPNVRGNRMTQGTAGAIGVDFEATVDTPVVDGNDFQLDVPIQNDLLNTVGGRIQTNHNVTMPRPLTANSATPSVGSATVVATANTVATTITNFAGGRDGQLLFVLCGPNDTIQHNGTIHTNGGGNIVGAAGMTVGFIRNGAVWQEVSRVTAS